MARTGGRSLWVAVPAGLLCVAVVGALLWLAIPMVPVAVAWVGDALRSSAEQSAAVAEEPAPAELVKAGAAIDCRDLYPDSLWAEMIWHGDVLLGQSTARPPIAAPELADALAPTMFQTCTWSFADGEKVVSAIGSVGADAAGVAEPTLTAQGFACSTQDGALSCARTQGGSTEEHVLRDGLWLASVESGWVPEDYGTRLADHVWG